MSFTIDHRLDQSVTVTAAGTELFTYTYSPDTVQLESPKPYLHPLRTLAGDVVSLFRPHDHVWHKGIAWALPHVGEHNFWGGPTYVQKPEDAPGQGSYIQLENNGRANSAPLTELAAGKDSAHIEHRLDWTTQHGELMIQEQRRISARIAGAGAAWALTFDTAMTNVSGASISFGSPTTKGRENAGYGGLFWRGPRSFTGGVIHAPGASGGEELRGTREEWMGFSGQHDETERWSTIVMVDAQDNPLHPPRWFTRNENFACLCPAPFFSEEYDLPQDQTLRLRYAVVIADGMNSREDVARLASWGREALS
ncbi:PmoA family protein [Paenarthrobacter aurescens]|jgi:hypothetical protein|uniref:Oxidoreductase n=1 Tax=Paenarthrobacter aurescens (strain TC1) TaxID=290340 RepID=A1RDH7_PAEAT|nr:PmoA family protein [Paenarthrobacter aurescens]ABM10748.1 conserved hypothetical protein [Paenarthrobacter aurescens TC1]